ncbi:DMT family transporter [Bacillus alveayuensis]|jgi:drug/metabolite transporter (DMT)-like permease|uniref:Drug/metabolite transporter (DMT)-like permease n=1 Tax=Aeribacillus alveayuensis TaxID=279215 RepID=A0ABT9VP93_9BACI|nr:DMT family transporter [Bacillus alveayuensis]MDQ0162801.1 drug/metabolite transporter (DMT)-like permease [Bacillus alveayuensis]
MKKQLMADVLLLSVALIWGVTFVVVQNAIQILPPHLFNGIRFAMAGVFLTILMIHPTYHIRFTRTIFINGFILGLFLFFGYAFQTLGLMYTTSSKAGFITGLSVMMVPFLSVWLLKEKLKPLSIVGAIMGTIGLFLLTMGDFTKLNLGDLLVLFCAFAFAFHIIFTDKYSKKLQAYPLTIVQIFTVSIFSFIASFLFEIWKYPINWNMVANTKVIIALFVTSLLATAYAFVVQTKFQAYTTASRVALIFAMEPVFAAITAFIYQNERLTILSGIGCLLIFLAMIISELPHDSIWRLKKPEQNRSV